MAVLCDEGVLCVVGVARVEGVLCVVGVVRVEGVL